MTEKKETDAERRARLFGLGNCPFGKGQGGGMIHHDGGNVVHGPGGDAKSEQEKEGENGPSKD